jgi:4a-hydroxytetrahydrobiopterin dehydratase
MSELSQKKCQACEGGVEPLAAERVRELVQQVYGWQLEATGKGIGRKFQFRNFLENMAFVNAVAWIAHQEDHHPDLEVSYKTCVVRFTTHAIDGLSDNDFICAAKVNEAYER